MKQPGCQLTTSDRCRQARINVLVSIRRALVVQPVGWTGRATGAGSLLARRAVGPRAIGPPRGPHDSPSDPQSAGSDGATEEGRSPSRCFSLKQLERLARSTWGVCRRGMPPRAIDWPPDVDSSNHPAQVSKSLRRWIGHPSDGLVSGVAGSLRAILRG